MRKPRLVLVVVASLSLLLALSGAASASQTARHLNALDDCDSLSFNAVIGPGTCTKDGQIRFRTEIVISSP